MIIFAVIGKKAGWIGGAEKKQVATEKVTKRDIIEVVSASGKIQPEVEVKISPIEIPPAICVTLHFLNLLLKNSKLH